MKDRQGTGMYPDSPVPEAMGKLLALLGERIGEDAVDRVWIFPPLVKGRKEWGLVAVSCLVHDPLRRSLVTGRYHAELTGQGMTFEPQILTEGSAPPERLPVVMDGVVRRSELQLGIPRVVDVGGNPQRFQAMLEEYVSDVAEEWPEAGKGTSGPNEGRT